MDVSYSIDVYHGDAYTGRTLPDGKYEMVAIDWAKTGFNMAFMKSSQGLTWKDPAFDLQWKAAQGLKRVAYHFFEPDPDAIKQAANMRRVVEPVFTDNDYLAVDFEPYYPGGQPSVRPLLDRPLWMGSFLFELSKWVPDKQRIFIYTGVSYWYACGGKNHAWASAYRLWQAIWPWDNYFKYKLFPPYTWTPAQVAEKKALIESGVAKPPICIPWTKTDVWQWTAKFDPSQITGYYSNKKAVDYDAVYMDTGTPPQYITCPTCNGTGKVEV